MLFQWLGIRWHDQVLRVNMYNMLGRFIEVLELVEFFSVFSHVPIVLTCLTKQRVQLGCGLLKYFVLIQLLVPLRSSTLFCAIDHPV